MCAVMLPCYITCLAQLGSGTLVLMKREQSNDKTHLSLTLNRNLGECILACMCACESDVQLYCVRGVVSLTNIHNIQTGQAVRDSRIKSDGHGIVGNRKHSSGIPAAHPSGLTLP